MNNIIFFVLGFALGRHHGVQQCKALNTTHEEDSGIKQDDKSTVEQEDTVPKKGKEEHSPQELKKEQSKNDKKTGQEMAAEEGEQGDDLQSGKDNGQNKKVAVAKVKKTFRQYYIVDSPKPINPEDVSVDVKPKSVNTNFLVLAALWAHYEACRQGILEAKTPAPWEKINKNQIENQSDKQWIDFLSFLITDTDWVNWIREPAEVKKRAINAFKKTVNLHSS